ncbi:hypothetical protein BY996DRAFT_7285407 [Phakopsora pachyrhizi]|nr:hypothetical protein BY996DRAFT_7717048 [Phakopsora pachyrhizi]KAI8451597.1 hypothetical protein BY996DRAFT_7285407 [Phakopsora pachyrhizi]
MQELIAGLYESIDILKRGTINLISLSAGCDLFLRFLMMQQSPSNSIEFIDHKQTLVLRAKKFVIESRLKCVEKVANLASDFIEDNSTIMIHGYSRVVLQSILKANSKTQKPKKRFKVFVTESRPSGLGLKTHAILERNGIPCVVLLDSAVAYAMAKVDLVLVGAEAVLEDGGLINYIGSYQMAIAAKAHHKPFYALTESYKFLRLFPLSQYDLPTNNLTLQFPNPPKPSIDTLEKRNKNLEISDNFDEIDLPGSIAQRRGAANSLLKRLNSDKRVLITPEQIEKNNPTLDYTTPDLISLVISDSGILTPPGVAEVLLSIFGAE